MSEKFRVMFKVPDVIMKNELRKPVEIPEDDYVRLRMAEHKGDMEALAQYIKNRFYKPGTSLSCFDDISMTTAPGNPFYIMLIDQAIAEGRDPYEARNQDGGNDEYDYVSSDKDYSTNAFDEFIIRYVPFWEKFTKETRKNILCGFGIVCIIAAFFIAAACVGSDGKKSDTQTTEEKLDDIKNNAADVWDNIKSIGDDKN